MTLTRLLDARGLSDAEFSRKVGLSKAILSMLKHRRIGKLPAKVAVARWAKALGLNQAEESALLESALLTYSPEGMASLLEKLKAR